MKTLATAFKEVYGEALKEYGFKKVKGKYPYYARIIGDEIVHVITYKEEWCAGQNLKAFSVLGGVATVYRGKITFDRSPKGNVGWLKKNNNIYGCKHHYDSDVEYVKKIIKFEYDFKKEESMMEAVKYSFEVTKEYLLRYINEVQNLRACLEYFYTFNSSDLAIYLEENFGRQWSGYENNEGLLNTIVYGSEGYDEFVKINWENHNRFEKLEEYWIEIGKSGLTKEEHEKYKIEREKSVEQRIKNYKVVVSDEEWKEKIKNELEERKKNNLQVLKNCGLI